MSLSDTRVRSAKPKDKPYKLADEKGLFLYVTPSSKLWRMAYRYAGKQKLLSFGSYPEISLSAAREKREGARKLLREGMDPGAIRKEEKVKALLNQQGAVPSNTFQSISMEWLKKQKEVLTPATAVRLESRLVRFAYPALGHIDISKIRPADVLALLMPIEASGRKETAHRLASIISRISRYAVATLRAESDPTVPLRGALMPYRDKHRAALLKAEDIGDFLRRAKQYRGGPVVSAALLLQALWFVRPGELRKAEWNEFDLKNQAWNIPKEKMKMREPHLVPLSTQAIAILEKLRAITGQTAFVFPGGRSTEKPLSENAVLMALRIMGYAKDQVTGHGFRATARTFLDEELGFRPEVIEMQLAHTVKDHLGRAYNRTHYLQERQRMMQVWSDWLTDLAGEPLVD
ncbi:MAG: integrase arm-type DNA-binding domain-containing protein [Acidithiobacillus sp.]|nr:integrase arm-type DNA-binding domain-containing protein [Acidithiobacillus sp.]